MHVKKDKAYRNSVFQRLPKAKLNVLVIINVTEYQEPISHGIT